MFTHTTQCTRDVLDPSVSVFSFSLHRHPFIYTLFTSRFTLIINNNGKVSTTLITVGLVPLVLDLLIVHDRFGSSSDPSLNGHLRYPNNSMRLPLTRSESVDLTKILTPRQWSLLYLLFLVRLGDYKVNSCDFYSYRLASSSHFTYHTHKLLVY
jgi:hypothetical protein